MAILGKPGSQIEVRLGKLPIKKESPTYFEEYAPIDERDNLTDSITRYIVPDEQAYGITIISKKGYTPGELVGGFAILVQDNATGTIIMHH